MNPIAMPSPEKLSLNDFKTRLVKGSFPEFSNVSAALEGMRFVQADPIRSPARAQDLILRQRVANYRAGELEQCFPDLDAEEGYLFAYGFMTPEIWDDLQKQPRSKLTKSEREILSFVAELGEVHPRDLVEQFGRRSVTNYWGGKSRATKRILEALHEDGFLRVSRREKGVRLYGLPKRSGKTPSSSEDRYARLALTTAHVFGPTTKRFLVSELGSLKYLVSKRSKRESVIDHLVSSGQLSEVEVEGVTYLWVREKWREGETEEKVRILAPFDPLVRDRERFEQVWGWRYRFEAYTPASKRERGYYAMPLLWRDHMIGWVNASVDGSKLKVKIGYVAKSPRSKAFRSELEAETEAMATFLGLKSGAWEIFG